MPSNDTDRPHHRFWPKRLPRELVVPETSLWFNLEVSAARFPSKPATLFFGERLSFSAAKNQALAIAGWLQSVGVKKRDRVALFMQNCPQYLAAFYGLDPLRQRMVEWPAGRSRLTMLLYLDGAGEGVQGGATRLLDSGGQSVDVTPRRGTALFFRHGFHPGSVRHIGCTVSGPVPKYVARINVTYDDSISVPELS